MLAAENGVPDALRLMVYARGILEVHVGEDRGWLPLLRLFCDWVVHVEITKNSTAVALVERLANVIYRVHESRGQSKDDSRRPIMDEFEAEISFAKLRNDFRSLHSAYRLVERPFFDSFSQWNRFVSSLLSELTEKPLGLPWNVADLSGKSKVRQAFDRMSGRGMTFEDGTPFVPSQLLVGPCATELNDGRACWELRHPADRGRTTSFAFPIALEPRNEFARD